MSAKDGGGPAFPLPTSKYGEDGQLLHASLTDEHKGMSLRDYFAGQALLGLCANARYVDEVREFTSNDGREGAALNARNAYRIADAMLKAREEGR